MSIPIAAYNLSIRIHCRIYVDTHIHSDNVSFEHLCLQFVYGPCAVRPSLMPGTGMRCSRRAPHREFDLEVVARLKQPSVR